MERESRERPLRGARILVADDEVLIALDVEATIREAGAEVVGPCTTLSDAEKVARSETIDAAVLDIRLGEETTDCIVQELTQRGIPFVFYSGQSLSNMTGRWTNPPRVLVKPVPQLVLVEAVAQLLHRNFASG
jgi:DNA-binding response OmpR family regulator